MYGNLVALQNCKHTHLHRYAAHQVAAGPLRTGLAALLDLVFAGCSLGTSCLVSFVLVCALPLRQSLGQRLMCIYPVREVGFI